MVQLWQFSYTFITLKNVLIFITFTNKDEFACRLSKILMRFYVRRPNKIHRSAEIKLFSRFFLMLYK